MTFEMCKKDEHPVSVSVCWPPSHSPQLGVSCSILLLSFFIEA